MKKIYLIFTFLLLTISNAIAQRIVNLQTTSHKAGTTYAPPPLSSSSRFVANTSGSTELICTWTFKNLGPDTLALKDTLMIRMKVADTSFTFSFPLTMGGLRKDDSFELIPTPTAWGPFVSGTTYACVIKLTPYTFWKSPPAGYYTTKERWCDSVWAIKGLTNTPLVLTDALNDELCDSVTFDIENIWHANVNLISGKENGILMFPNPAYNKVSLRYDFGVNATANVTVVDITGKTVYQQDLASNISGMKTFNLDLAGLPKGLYILKLNTNDKVVTHRFNMM